MSATATGRNIANVGGTNWLRSSIHHERDPKDVILEQIGELPDGIVQFSRILVAIYVRPIMADEKGDRRTQGGIILPGERVEKEKQEDHYQGKVGLIVAVGEQAYEDDDANNVRFHGVKNGVGDWVWFRPSDGLGCEVNGVSCRILQEGHIIGRLPHPDVVW